MVLKKINPGTNFALTFLKVGAYERRVSLVFVTECGLSQVVVSGDHSLAVECRFPIVVASHCGAWDLGCLSGL